MSKNSLGCQPILALLPCSCLHTAHQLSSVHLYFTHLGAMLCFIAYITHSRVQLDGCGRAVCRWALEKL